MSATLRPASPVRVGFWFFVLFAFGTFGLFGQPSHALERLPLDASPGEVVEISFDVTSQREDGTRVVRSTGEYHLLADVPIEAMVAVFEDHDGLMDVVPRMMDYEWEPVSDSGNRSVIMERQVVGITFMGFEAAYDLLQRSETINNLDQSPRSFVVRYQMTESLDDKLAANEGTYYLEAVRVDGRDMTYMRQYNHTAIKDTFPGLRAVLRGFSPSDTAKLFEALIAAAQ